MLSLTVQEILRQARLANGSMGDGMVMSAEEAQDDLLALNIMLAEWSAAGHGVYADVEDTFTLAANTATYTWGTGGVFNSLRPIDVQDQTFIRYLNVDYPVRLITQEEYNGIPYKLNTAMPDVVMYEPTFPLATCSFYPVPDKTYTIYFTSSKELTTLTGLTTTISLPPEYLGAIKWNLSIELCPNYNVPVNPVVVDKANNSLKIIKRLATVRMIEPINQSFGGSANDDLYVEDIHKG